ncbi:hypothetical protein [Cytobacillus praedii]|uniref:Uncharacterized protein n=1 Tax=Cytobacillus praedii TaxID=1742358 RepID=A0A4R1AV93_9BACI|nr:hypothetical protein [Cytobacillus praedii]TCJ02286.1 hypothetical protein E0Y62_20245 [Cytobacillus praedii]
MLANIGASSIVLVFNIIFLIVGLFLLYIVISAGVKAGINKSVVGQLIEKKYGVNENKQSILHKELDNDK